MSDIARKTLLSQIAKSDDLRWDTAGAEGGSVALRGDTSIGLIRWNPDHTYTCTAVVWTDGRRRELSEVIMGAREAMKFVSTHSA